MCTSPLDIVMTTQVNTSLFDFEAAATLPPEIRFGTSTWTYPGWKGMIYHRAYSSEKKFTSDSLAEYAAFPWFRTVGIDSTFYTPPKRATLEHYASQVGPDFLWVSKVWEHLTAPKFPSHPRYGKFSGLANPRFLDPQTFIEQVLPAYRGSPVQPRTGPFVFQFPAIAKSVMSVEQFFECLDRFLGALPEDFRYATEIRNKEFLTNDYFSILNHHGATHCFNHWSSMPRLLNQMKAAADAGGLTASFYVTRILTPLGVSYEKAVEHFSPYDRMQRPNQEMREDVVRLVKRAIDTKKSAFVIVNNRAEGNAPLTIDAIGRMAVGAAPLPSPSPETELN